LPSATILDGSWHTARSRFDALMPGDSARRPVGYQDLVRLQECLAASSPLAWTPSNGAITIGGVWSWDRPVLRVGRQDP
jgi:hypothetical protein